MPLIVSYRLVLYEIKQTNKTCKTNTHPQVNTSTKTLKTKQYLDYLLQYWPNFELIHKQDKLQKSK